MITAETKVGTLLDEHPDLVDFLAHYHPHFGRLRNRLLRRIMAPRVSIADAARMAGLAPEALLAAVREALGEAMPAVASAPAAEWRPSPMPAVLAAMDDAHRVTVDVRDELRRGQEPFARIMAAVKNLRPGQALVLRAPFEPVPLYDVLGRRGFGHWTERRDEDDWVVWFWLDAELKAPAEALAGAAAPVSNDILDVRGLPPPQPMILVLERLAGLMPGETLEVLHERRPLFLYPQLDERGFVHVTDEPAPGVVRIRIRREGAAA